MSAAGRRAELVRILRGRQTDTIENLARDLNVSRKTIQRDLLTLTVDEGYHIDTLKGNGGGVVFRDVKNPLIGILSMEQKQVLTEAVSCVSDYQAKVINEILVAFG